MESVKDDDLKSCDACWLDRGNRELESSIKCSWWTRGCSWWTRTKRCAHAHASREISRELKNECCDENYVYENGISVSRDIGTRFTCTGDSRLKLRNSRSSFHKQRNSCNIQICCGPIVYHLPTVLDCFAGLTRKWVGVTETTD